MDHPSKEWKDAKTQDLLEDKTRNKVLNYHFRFKGLVDENDYTKCLFWEQLTIFYLEQNGELLQMPIT